MQANPSRARSDAVAAESPPPDDPSTESSAKELCAKEAIPLFVMSDADDAVAIKKAFRHVAVSAARQL